MSSDKDDYVKNVCIRQGFCKLMETNKDMKQMSNIYFILSVLFKIHVLILNTLITIILCWILKTFFVHCLYYYY